MAKVISLNLDDRLFEEVIRLTETLGTSRTRYINEAIEAYNKKKTREQLAETFKREVPLIRESSMEILQDYEAI